MIYRNISISFWSDPKVEDDFTPEDKYFYLYLLTNPHTNISGCYQISNKQFVNETGYNMDTINRLLNRMEHSHKVIRYDASTKEILVLNWGRYNWTRSANVLKAVESVAAHIKNDQFRDYVYKLVQRKRAKGTDTDNSIQNTDTDNSIQNTDTDNSIQNTDTDNSIQNTDTDTDVGIGYAYGMDTVSESNPKVHDLKYIIPPTLEMVRDYCQERNNNIDPQSFCDFYQSKGWMVGKNKMKDWHAAIGTWERSRAEKQKPERKSTFQRIMEVQTDDDGGI